MLLLQNINNENIHTALKELLQDTMHDAAAL